MAEIDKKYQYWGRVGCLSGSVEMLHCSMKKLELAKRLDSTLIEGPPSLALRGLTQEGFQKPIL